MLVNTRLREIGAARFKNLQGETWEILPNPGVTKPAADRSPEVGRGLMKGVKHNLRPPLPLASSGSDQQYLAKLTFVTS